MNLDELKLQVQNDLKVNDENLDTESLKNQEIKAKYLDKKEIINVYIVKSGNIMVERLMPKYM